MVYGTTSSCISTKRCRMMLDRIIIRRKYYIFAEYYKNRDKKLSNENDIIDNFSILKQMKIVIPN